MTKFTLPQYNDDLLGFIGALRASVFDSQSKAAQYFSTHYFPINRSTINKYERGGIKPDISYVYCLAQLFCQRVQYENKGDVFNYQKKLLFEINKIITHEYFDKDEPPLKNWAELCSLADEYIATQKEKKSSTSKSIQKPVVIDKDPYPGLRAFQEEEAPFFFGREKLVEQLLQEVEDKPLLFVVGSSGSGKSSVVQAGLIPALKSGELPGSEQWCYAKVIRSGADPLQELAIEITRLKEGKAVTELYGLFMKETRTLWDEIKFILSEQSAKRFVLVVDQFEELWTHIPVEVAKRQDFERNSNCFINQLVTAISANSNSVLIILTLRHDFFPHALDNHALAPWIANHHVIVTSMNSDELQQAIEQPAFEVGGKFEAGLVQELIKQTAKRPGALPLLEYTLRELWEAKQSDGLLTWGMFHAVGEVEGALAKQADKILEQNYNKLEHRDKLRHILLRLVPIIGDTIDTRRRVYLEELVSVGESIETIQAFLIPLINERLLTIDRDTTTNKENIELSHETLIRNWPTLKGWIEENQEFVQHQRQLETATKIWAGQHHNYLWNGTQLENAQKWLIRMQPQLNEQEKNFLDTSESWENKTKTIQRRWFRGLSLAATVFFLMMIFAGEQWWEAQNKAIEMRQAMANSIATQAQMVRSQLKDSQLSLLLALEAIHVTRQANEPPVLAAEQALRDALAITGGIGLNGHNGEINTVAFSPDNHWLVTGSKDKTARLWNFSGLTATDTISQWIPLIGHTGEINTAAFSSDNRWLVTASEDKTARLWDLMGLNIGEQFITLHHTSEIKTVAFSANRHWLVTAGTDGIAYLWDLTMDNPADHPILLTGHTAKINTLAISPNNHWLATASDDETVRLWDLQMLNPMAHVITLSGHQGGAKTLAISPDSGLVVTVSGDGSTFLWDLITDNPSLHSIKLTDSRGGVNAVAISSDSHWLVTGGRDGDVIRWDLTTINPKADSVQLLEKNKSQILVMAIKPDNQLLIAASANGLVRMSGLITPTDSLDLHGHTKAVKSMVISPNGHWLATGSADFSTRLWDLTMANPAIAQPIILAQHSVLFATTRSINKAIITISPDHHWLVTTGEDGNVYVWDLTMPQVHLHSILLHGHAQPICSMAISSDSRWLITADLNKTVLRWSLFNLSAPPETITNQLKPTCPIALSPDNHWLFTSSENGQLLGWDLTDLSKQPAMFNDIGVIRAIVISSDQHWLTAVTDNKHIYVWDLSTSIQQQQPKIFAGHTTFIRDMIISSDNRWLVTASDDATTQLWDLTTNDPTISAHTFSLPNYTTQISRTHVAMSPDNHWLVMASADTNIRLYNFTMSNEPILLPRNHEGEIWIAMTPDNQQLAVAGSEDGYVNLWHLAMSDARNEDIILNNPIKGRSRALTISPDNRWLVTVNDNENINLWQLQFESLVQLACHTAGRNLTQDEWKKYFHDQEYHKTCEQQP